MELPGILIRCCTIVDDIDLRAILSRVMCSCKTRGGRKRNMEMLYFLLSPM